MGETGTEGRTVGHCEKLEGMSERVGRDEGLDGYIRWWWRFLAVIHQVDLGRRSTSSPIFSEPFWDLSLVCRVVLVHTWVVDSGAVIHDVFGCLLSISTFSTDGVYGAPYFVQPVLELRVVSTSQTTNRCLLFP